MGAGNAQDFLNVLFRERMTRRVQAFECRYLVPTHGVFPLMAPRTGTVVLEPRRVRTLIQRVPDAPVEAGRIRLDAIKLAVQWQPGLAIVLIKPKGVAAQVLGQRDRMGIGIDARLAEAHRPIDTPLHQAFDEHRGLQSAHRAHDAAYHQHLCNVFADVVYMLHGVFDFIVPPVFVSNERFAGKLIEGDHGHDFTQHRHKEPGHVEQVHAIVFKAFDQCIVSLLVHLRGRHRDCL